MFPGVGLPMLIPLGVGRQEMEPIQIIISQTICCVFACMRMKLNWLAHEFFFADLHNDNLEVSYAATMFHAIADFLWVIDRSPMFMNAVQTAAAYKAGRTYLKSAMLLADYCLARGIMRWKYRPKLHYLDHQIDELLDGWNPRFWQCWMDEDFMGKVASLAGHCHPRTCAYRAMAYLRCLHVLFYCIVLDRVVLEPKAILCGPMGATVVTDIGHVAGSPGSLICI